MSSAPGLRNPVKIGHGEFDAGQVATATRGGTLREEDLPPLTGSALLDPWRIRLRLHLRGQLEPRQTRPPTASEQLLWEALESEGVGWRREYATGPYRLDFYLPQAGLAVEVDGPSHWGRDAATRDALRDAWHVAKGIRTLRVTDREVMTDLGAVLHLISRELQVRELAGVPAARGMGLPNEVAVLTESAPAVEAALVRIAQACRTVLPELEPSRSSLLRRWLMDLV